MSFGAEDRRFVVMYVTRLFLPADTPQHMMRRTLTASSIANTQGP